MSQQGAGGFWAGALEIAPISLMAAPFGILWGAVAVQKGMSVGEALLMSAVVFAGSAQFVALELWTEPLPILGLAMMALLVNARHVMMGAALGRNWRTDRAPHRLGAQFFMTDEVWAVSLRWAMRGELTFAAYLGMGVTLYVGWALWTGLGAVAGALLDDPARYGADFAFTALFLVMILGFYRDAGRGPVATLIPIGVASLVAVLMTKLQVGGVGLSILAGGLAGCVAAAFMPVKRTEPAA